MACLEETLSKHRQALTRHMAEWTQQLDEILAQYMQPSSVSPQASVVCLDESLRLDQQLCAAVTIKAGSRTAPKTRRGALGCTDLGDKRLPGGSAQGITESSSVGPPASSKSCAVAAEAQRQLPAANAAHNVRLLEGSCGPGATQPSNTFASETEGSDANGECAKRPSHNSNLSISEWPSYRHTLQTDGIKAGISFTTMMSSTGRMRSGSSARLVESSSFNFVVAAIIIANLGFMAFSTDHLLDAAWNMSTPDNTFLVTAEVVFTICYVIEILLKLVAYGKGFFFGKECSWRLFDVFVVLTSILDLVAPFLVGSGVNLSYLRVHRIFKLVKTIRVVKVYSLFRELRLIVTSFLSCAKTMMWALALITMVLFTFSLLFVQGVTSFLLTRPPEDWNDGFITNWGSTGRAMLSLFQSSTGGVDWAEVAEPLYELGWLYYAAFMFYISFFLFVVVNVLTGLIVDAALEASDKDEALMIREQMRSKQEYVGQIQTLFSRLDDTASGELTWDQFEKGMHCADMLAFASSLDIEISDISEFFRLISSDGHEAVDIEKFVVGCMKLKGSAKSLDLSSLSHRIRRIEHDVKKLLSKTDKRLTQMRVVGPGMTHETQRISVSTQDILAV